MFRMPHTGYRLQDTGFGIPDSNQLAVDCCCSYSLQILILLLLRPFTSDLRLPVSLTYNLKLTTYNKFHPRQM